MSRFDAHTPSRGSSRGRGGPFTDADFELAEVLDDALGITALEERRRRELLTVVHCLADADRVVADVRRAMTGPYDGLFRLTCLNARCRLAMARVTRLNEELADKLRQVDERAGSTRVSEVLKHQLRLHLDVEAELVASLSPERRALVDGLSW